MLVHVPWWPFKILVNKYTHIQNQLFSVCRTVYGIYWVKKFRTCHPNYASQYIDYFMLKDLKISNCKEKFSLNSPYLPKTDAPKVPQLFSVLSLGFSLPRDDFCHRRADLKSTPQGDKHCHKLLYLPSVLLRAHSAFLIIIYSPLNDLYPPCPSHLKMIHAFQHFFEHSLLSCDTLCT